MKPPFSSLVFLALGLSISLCAFLVESQSQNGKNFFPPPPPPPSPASPPPPSPPPPPPPPESPNSPPPPASPNSPPPPESPGPPPHDHPANQVNSKNDSNGPPPAPHRRWKNNNSRHRRPPPPHPRHKYNAGKKIGLLFVGMASILQIGVIGFLVFKRRQLLKVKDRYETCS